MSCLTAKTTWLVSSWKSLSLFFLNTFNSVSSTWYFMENDDSTKSMFALVKCSHSDDLQLNVTAHCDVKVTHDFRWHFNNNYPQLHICYRCTATALFPLKHMIIWTPQQCTVLTRAVTVNQSTSHLFCGTPDRWLNLLPLDRARLVVSSSQIFKPS